MNAFVRNRFINNTPNNELHDRYVGGPQLADRRGIVGSKVCSEANL